MNFLLRTYAWLNLLDDGGILFNICRNLGLPTFSVVGTNRGNHYGYDLQLPAIYGSSAV